MESDGIHERREVPQEWSNLKPQSLSYSEWLPRFQIKNSSPAETTPNSLQNPSRSISCWGMANLLYPATLQWIMVLKNPVFIEMWFDIDKKNTDSSLSFRLYSHCSNRNIWSGVRLMWGAAWSVITPWPLWWPWTPKLSHSPTQKRQIDIPQDHKSRELYCQSGNRFQKLRQGDCHATGRLTQQQQLQLISRAQQ